MKNNYKIGNCAIGQMKVKINDQLTKNRYVLCEGTPFCYLHSSSCSPRGYIYEYANGMRYENIFDESEYFIVDKNGNYMSKCEELDYSPFRPLILRLFGEPEKYELFSSIKINQVLPLSSVLTIANKMDILNNGKIWHDEAKELLASVQREPENFGFEEKAPQKSLGTK